MENCEAHFSKNLVYVALCKRKKRKKLENRVWSVNIQTMKYEV